MFLQINPTAFTLFNLDIQWYGLLIALGGILGYLVYMREGQRFALDQEMLLDVVFWAVLCGLLGARLYYVLFSLDYYLANPLEIINVRGGGMAIYGGVIGGVIGAYVITQRYQQNFIQILDIAVPGLLVGQIIGRWGNFVNQEAYGEPVPRSFLENLFLPDSFIEQMHIHGQYHHPTFLYESLWNLVGFIIIIVLRRQPKLLKAGDIVAFYMLWYGLGRAWIEGLRMDSLYLGPLRVSQWLSIILVLLGLYLFYRHHRPGNTQDYYSEGRLQSL